MVNNDNLIIRLEDKLLICCSRTRVNTQIREKIVSLIQEDLDWQHLLQMAARHGLKPLLYHNLNSICPEKVPEDILSELKNYFNANARKNLLLTGELIKILKLLKFNDIDAIPFKGPSLAILAYDNISLREFNDLDIIINNCYNPEVYELMLSLGYELTYYPKKMDISLYFKTQSEHKFINKSTNIVVEIHNKFQGHFFSFPINPEFLYEKDTLKILFFNNHQIRCLSNEYLILMLSIHCARHNWSRLFWICDIYQMVQFNEIKWSEVLETAEKLKVKRILLITLYLASDLFGLELSDDIMFHLKNDSNIKNISLKLKKRLFSGNDKYLDLFERTILDLKKRESLKMGLIDIFSSMLRPTYLDFAELPLPKSLYPLYYLIRPFLLLKRFG